MIWRQEWCHRLGDILPNIMNRILCSLYPYITVKYVTKSRKFIGFRTYSVPMSQIAKTLWSISIRHRSDTFSSGQYPIDFDPRPITVWVMSILKNKRPYYIGILLQQIQLLVSRGKVKRFLTQINNCTIWAITMHMNPWTRIRVLGMKRIHGMALAYIPGKLCY